MKAWQKQIREQKAITAAAENLFGAWWDEIDLDIKKAEVREVSIATARKIILEYEWLQCMPAVVWHCFGIFFQGNCGGVVVYGPEYSENWDCWDKYGFKGRMILLSRGACTHWAHPHAASKLIRQSMRLLPAKYEVVTSTVDDLAGEIGTIYQACGFHYVGSMRDGNPNVKSRKGDRSAWMIKGKLYGARSIRQKIGNTRKENMALYFPDAEHVKQNSKGRYFCFRGNRKTQSQHFAAIRHLVKPYPKRAVEVSGETRTESIGEGVGQFHVTAP